LAKRTAQPFAVKLSVRHTLAIAAILLVQAASAFPNPRQQQSSKLDRALREASWSLHAGSSVRIACWAPPCAAWDNDNIVWGTSDDNIVWGTSEDNIVWWTGVLGGDRD
jgi:hypothetical protein